MLIKIHNWVSQTLSHIYRVVQAQIPVFPVGEIRPYDPSAGADASAFLGNNRSAKCPQRQSTISCRIADEYTLQ